MKLLKVIISLLLLGLLAMTLGCASNRPNKYLADAWLHGSLCQELVQNANQYFKKHGEYPSEEQLSALVPLETDNPSYYIRRIQNLYSQPREESVYGNEFQYYAKKGVIYVRSYYQGTEWPGEVVITDGSQEANVWFHTQLATDLLLKCSRRELTASAAAQEMSRWTVDEAARPVIEKYALGSINGFLREGDFSEALAFGYAQGIADVISDPSCVPPSLR